ncbi:MAG TPA: NAD kinase [Bacteroidales bacterium]|nr:NAD kinase [Bacteroidales bacterium]
MRVAVYSRTFDEDFLQHIKDFFHCLGEYNFEIYVYQDFLYFLKQRFDYVPAYHDTFTGYQDIRNDIDFVFSIGGDGTFLDTLTLVRDTGIPVIGINSGKLGFLASISKDCIKEAIGSLFRGDYATEERSLLASYSGNEELDRFGYALNDITIQKKESEMITIHVYLNGNFLNSYWSDGLIIATPTGSTAYSLSVGGPIVLPDSHNFIISPISPHNLTVRPIVVPDDSEILLRPEGRSGRYLVSMDHRHHVMEGTTSIRIRKAPFTMRVLRLHNTSFYSTLRTKLMWGVDKRN